MLRLDWNLLFTVINLLLLFVLMKIFLFKPVQKILDERQTEADRQFDEAKARQDAADGMKAQYEQSMADIEKQREDTLREVRRNADAEYHRIVEDAQDKAKQIKDDAVAEAENKKTQILKKAEKEIADMVVDAAVKVVEEKEGAAVDSSLYNEFLNKAGDK